MATSRAGLIDPALWPRCDAPAGELDGNRQLGTQRASWVPARRLPWLRNRLNRLTIDQ
jgi:hypothetical protein